MKKFKIPEFNSELLTKNAVYFYAAITGIFSAILLLSVVDYLFTKPKNISSFQAKVKVNNNNKIYEEITKKNIFSIEMSTAQQVTNITQAPVQSGFNGKLTGVMVGSVPVKNKAIILVGQDVYVLKQGVEQDGYLLKNTRLDGALISYGSQDYDLQLEDTGIKTAGLPSRGGRNPQPELNKPQTSGDTLVVNVERGEIVEQLKNINNVIRGVLISPVINADKFEGYRISKLAEDSPLRQLGLQRNDIINRINGEEVEKPDVLFTMMRKVDEVNSVSIDITRNGVKQTLYIEIR